MSSDKAKETPNYYAIIPADVRYSQALCMGSKLLYGEITALCNRAGFCWASNSYFSDLYQKDSNTISRWIKELSEAGFITAEINKKEGNQRRLYLSTKIGEAIPKNGVTPIPKNVETPIPKNVVYNNTVLNTTVNTTIKGGKQKLPIEERKRNLFNLIGNYKLKNRGKYPDQFYQNFFNYWTEVNELKGGNEMRFETNEFFEVGRRLSTFWKFVKDEERSAMWKQQQTEAEKKQTVINFDTVLKTSMNDGTENQ